MHRFLIVLTTCLLAACATSPRSADTQAPQVSLQSLASDSEGQSFLVLVAHPDDENMLGPVLSSLARAGHAVRVVIATDGKYGTRITDLGPELLGPLRRKESECAMRALGLPPPVFLSIDRLDTRNGVRAYLDGRKQLLALLAQELMTTKPDAIITFGPDGEYGHPEHIVVGAAITELLLRQGMAETYPLFYHAWTREQVLDDDELAYIDRKYVTHSLVHDDQDEQRSFDAARCYRSQASPEEVQELIEQASRDTSNIFYFRKFSPPSTATGQSADRGRHELSFWPHQGLLERHSTHYTKRPTWLSAKGLVQPDVEGAAYCAPV